MLPEAARKWIADMGQGLLAKAIVGIEARQIDQSRLTAIEKRRYAMKKEMLKSWSPRIAPEVLKCRHYAGRRQGAPLRWEFGEWIEADGALDIGDIDVAGVIYAPRWQGVGYPLGQVAVRINHGNAVPGKDVEHGRHAELPSPGILASQ